MVRWSEGSPLRCWRGEAVLAKPGLILEKRSPSGQMSAAPSRSLQEQARANRGNTRVAVGSTLARAEDLVQWGIASGLTVDRYDFKG